MRADRQVRIHGLTMCQHQDLEDVKTYGETIIGRRCRGCGVVWGVAFCVGCQRERYCLVVSKDGKERYCTEDCRRQTIAARAQQKAKPVSRGRR